jgi:hypothetical protein
MLSIGAGITISPSNGTSISAVTALVHVDWRVISAANTFDCYIQARTSTGESALLRVYIVVTSSKFINSYLFL